MPRGLLPCRTIGRTVGVQLLEHLPDLAGDTLLDPCPKPERDAGRRLKEVKSGENLEGLERSQINAYLGTHHRCGDFLKAAPVHPALIPNRVCT